MIIMIVMVNVLINLITITATIAEAMAMSSRQCMILLRLVRSIDGHRQRAASRCRCDSHSSRRRHVETGIGGRRHASFHSDCSVATAETRSSTATNSSESSWDCAAGEGGRQLACIEPASRHHGAPPLTAGDAHASTRMCTAVSGCTAASTRTAVS